MRITFCLPYLSKKPVGGYKVVFEYANRLVDRNHQVNIVFFTDNNYSKLTKNKRIKNMIGKIENHFYPNWFKLNPKIKKIATATIKESIPDADFIFATSVETVSYVNNLPTIKGKKMYLIQDYENWNVSEEKLIATYKLDFVKFTVSHWLTEIVSKYSDKVVELSNPLNTEIFQVTKSISKRNRYTISGLYHVKPHKGFSTLFEALKLVQSAYPEICVHFFGVYPKPKEWSQYNWIRYTRNASSMQLLEIYNNSAIFACASVDEGFGLTGAESMLCGCALASTDYSGVNDYAKHNRNALLSPVNDAVKLAENIMELIENENLRIKLAEQGNKDMSMRNWDRNVLLLEEELLKNI